LAHAAVDPREQTRETSAVSILAAVNVVVWVGLFLYLWRLDRRISEAERERPKG
jgi:CcmD family protein